MKRRDFLRATSAAAAIGLMPKLAMPARAQTFNTLKFIPQADLAVIDPIGTTAYVTRNHAMMIFDTLYGVDNSFTAKPQMVEGHTIENDGKLWKMVLRPGLKFHDGEPVLARDVVASLKRWMSKDVFSQALVAVLEEISAPDDRTVQLRLSKPFPLLPDLLGKIGSYSTAIMPERLASTDAKTALTELVGSGPYRYVASERVPGSLNVYEKFADYIPRQELAEYLSGGKVAHFDRVEWHTIPDAATAAAALQAGEMDWWEQPTADLLPLFAAGNDVKTEIKDKSGNTGLLRMNCLQPPFDNPAIRRIVLQSIRQADFMLAVVGEDQSMWHTPVGFFHPDSVMASTEGLDTFTKEIDYEKVKGELKAAGYNGERVVIMSTADYPSIKAMCEVTADLFRKIGFNVDYQVLDWATVASRMKNQEGLDKGGWSVVCNFTAALSTYNPSAHTWLRSAGVKSFDGWPSIPRIEELRDEWFEASETAAQASIGAEIQKVALDQVPYVPLGLFYVPTAYRSNITDILNGIPLFWNVRRV
ncbi:MAG: ABC transporter substrate-binding protein [Mesorhizobium sp.]|nr:ABC transporter substrate-binding protein [Mesorhizobium sp.]MCO5161786.1 ABC transporter substrate-binding protein [Mesorhizobium sp.]